MTDPTPEDTTEQQEVTAEVVSQLDADQQREAAVAALSALPRAGQEEVFARVLGKPDPKIQRALWYIVVLTISAAIFVFGALTFTLILLGKNGEAPLALAATALGGFVGLIATSPAGRQR